MHYINSKSKTCSYGCIYKRSIAVRHKFLHQYKNYGDVYVNRIWIFCNMSSLEISITSYLKS